MRNLMRAVMIGTLLFVPLPALAGDPSASIPTASVGRWEGMAIEVPGIYLGPVKAKVALELKPDGTFTETWNEGARTSTTSGTWREHGNAVVLESGDPSHARQTLRRRGDALYTVALEPLPTGRATTMSIELHPADR